MNGYSSLKTRACPYDTININEMALVVYNATLNPDQRKEAEMMFGSQLKEKWYKLNEYCMDLKKYFRVAKSTRRDVVTTLDQIYGSDLPIELDFADSETQSISPIEETEPCEETPITQDDGIYDSDWLYSVCDDYLNSNPTSRDVFNASSLSDCIMSILESGGAEQNQEDLLNLLGVEAVEFVFTIMEHRDALLHAPDDSAVILKETGVSSSKQGQHSDELSSKPIDDLGLNATYLAQLKQQGLRLANEPKGYDDRYKGYMIGMKLDHSVTTDEKCGGQKTYHDGYEELVVQPQQQQKSQTIELVPVSQLEDWAQLVFEGIEKFNRLQSWVFDCAYNSDNNMLVCAPTGAGKTNVALLTIVHEIRKNMEEEGVLKREEMKVIYVAPMKALAQEIVGKFKERLSRLGLIVRELTGDMQLTRAEIAETQVIVTTPEKWDVITRKGGDNSLVEKVKLLILDEVHLLASDRGNVVESITARTLRQIESTQTPIRLVGLSATLPNYSDVAEFLHVNMEPGKGLFYCDDSFRPVPLTQRFLGVTITNKLKAIEKMYELAYDRCCEELLNDKQAMVFVHSRKDTLTTANKLIEYATEGRKQSLFATPIHHPRYDYFKQRVQRSHNQQLQNLFQYGLAIHHAGMRRSDRNLVEEMFAEGIVRVLCCTATLAWGVNLPAHGVIIKGTELYDASRGGWVNVDILDVIQIFGRAGRPQFDTTGEGCLIGMHDSIDSFARLMTPIESSFMKNLCDHLNAEIVAGTVTNLREAVIWLQYTYLYIRMRKNPLVYGISNEERMRDPSLFCKDMITDTAMKLDQAHMARYDMESGNLFPTDLGRVASHFYIGYNTVIVVNERLTDVSDLRTILTIVAMSQEFQSIKVRDEELSELVDMKRSCCRVGQDVKLDDEYAKTLILLQAYINQWNPHEATLFSDFNFISQNAGRITRALFEICIQRGWAMSGFLVLNLAKSVERRIWFTDHPLLQVPIHREKQELSLDDLREMSADEISGYLDQKAIGGTVKRLVRMVCVLMMN
ncbi:activating signal cointegrator 1 complex subunit 3 [Blastocystis sp. subtype 4]|uniref:activating signal cointegrator 1 complex subunit 3 n=1 Tax=Blastocystis sp. subtype 4 TaxID=944170 RepID=UPI0007118C56|nr:activating signal cointegrator 1 complex subunit 3 [Blastocystis sp. subtype 4]KNB44810.1 activating signal cointegrator 1 complex subunit 3 [Blastocystis sp. subtype 4]|eukprot:XP_014528253.1 activating signal cointegrator 1 complex subunit 3 [Blastocystis sp. subtype 4]